MNLLLLEIRNIPPSHIFFWMEKPDDIGSFDFTEGKQ